MTIPIYESEIGLEELLQKNVAKVYASNSLKKIKFSEEPGLLEKAVAKLDGRFKEPKNIDLYYLESILASINNNENDDWFLPEEIYKARHTPVFKQVNSMHNDSKIIGVITDSVLLDKEGNLVESEENASNVYDIATQAVIWKKWNNEEYETSVAEIINGIEQNKLFVSMEALFKNFDYILRPDREETYSIVARNDKTSFLTKHLRVFGGTGKVEINGKTFRVYRALRDFIFSGKGVVENPANKRSIIDNSLYSRIASGSEKNTFCSASLFEASACCSCCCSCCSCQNRDKEYDEEEGMTEEIYGYENLYVPEDYEYEDFGEEVEEIDSKTIALQYGKPSKNDPRKTPAPKKDQKKGSDKNDPGSAKDDSGKINFSENTIERLKAKVSGHNEKVRKSGKGKPVTLSQLKAVYRRGAGAYSTSHHPNMSRDGWGMARVNAFLYLMKNGRPSNPNYKQDNDLLPSSHDRSTKASLDNSIVSEELFDYWIEDFYRANSEKNKNVKLNKPFRTPGGPKKFSVYTKNEKGNIVKVNFGDPNMEIKRDDPNRRKNFRARHNCSNPGPKWKARYWSCRFWSSKNVNKLTSNILENKMDHEQLVQENDLLKKQVATLEEKIKVEAQAKLDSSKVELDAALAENQALKVSVTEAAEKMDKMKKGYEKQKEEDDEKMKEAKSTIETLQKELAEIKAEAVKTNRVSALVSADVPKEKAEEIVSTFASLDDDLFEKISVLYSNSNASAGSEDGLKDALEKSQASAKKETGDQKKQESPFGDTADLAKALAKKLFNQKD